MSAIASIERQLSQALANKSLAGAWPVMACLDLSGAHRGDRDAADGQRGAADLAAVDLQQRRRRHDGEIAVAAGELDERRLVPGRPERDADRGHDLVQLDRRGQIAGGEIRKRDLARAVRARDRHRRIVRGADRHELSGRIEMAERAADGAAVPGLAVADVHDGLMQQRTFRLHQVGEFEVALARHGADLERAAGLLDAGHPLDAGSSR